MAKERITRRFDPETVDRVKQLAADRDISEAEAWRYATDEGLAGVDATPEFEIPWKWCVADFAKFCEGDKRIEWTGLPLPDGQPFRLEGHLRLILKELFTKGRVELLVLLPKGCYKTTLFAALAVFHLLTVRNANCFIGAAEKEQADEMYRFASHFALAKDELDLLLDVRQSMRLIRSKRDQGFIRVLASDDSKSGGKKQAFNPTLALIDELHAHENPNLYVAMRTGVFKRNGLIATITTAGHDENSVLGQVRRQMLEVDAQGGTIDEGLKVTAKGLTRRTKAGRLTIARTKTGRTVMLEWACRPDDDLDDLAVVKLANPASAVTIESLEDAKEAPGIRPQDFARYRANVWADAPDAVFEAADWDALDTGATIPEGESVYVIVDAAQKSDTAAVTELWLRDDGQIIPRSHVWALKPRDQRRIPPAAHEYVDGRKIGQNRIRAHIRSINERNPVEGVIFDPMRFDESAEILEDEGFEMIEFPQVNQRLIPASQELYEAIVPTEGEEPLVEHDGDPILRAHVLAAAAKEVGESWRFSKARSKKVIDALMTLVMGVHEIRQGANRSEPFAFTVG